MTSIVTNPILRERAKNTVHRNLGRLIVMELIVAVLTAAAILLPFLLFMSQIKAAISNYQFALLSSYAGDELPALQPLATPALLSVLMALALSPLSMGLYKAHIDMARGLTPSYGTLFCRFPNMLGCIGLSLWITLKELLWMLPGFGTMFVLGFISIAAEAPLLSSITPFVSMVIILVCLIPASYRYYMANYIFADDPSEGVFGAVDKSKGMMQFRKWQLFKLTFLFSLISSIISNVIDQISGSASSEAPAALVIIGSLVALAACTYLDFLIRMSHTHFYDAYRY
ncbi:MAG: DUF975 family protein [Clostridia bacterium]|nr:DUF975 family protein [Clostridia bacterium]